MRLLLNPLSVSEDRETEGFRGVFRSGSNQWIYKLIIYSLVVLGEKMPQHNITYKGLKSTYAEVKEFIGNRFLNIHDLIDGFQRGLIVIRGSDGSEINEAYIVAGYFINHDGEAGNIQFEREPKQWTEKENRAKLRKGIILETIVDLDEKGNVILEKPRHSLSLMSATKTDRIPLERYLL